MVGSSFRIVMTVIQGITEIAVFTWATGITASLVFHKNAKVTENRMSEIYERSEGQSPPP